MRRASFVILIALVLLGVWYLAGRPNAAVAQGAPAEIDFTIRVYACEQNPVSVGIASEDPKECRRVDGVAVSVAAPGGTEVAVCTTVDGQCLVQALYGADVLVTEDVATIPNGYRPRQNPIATRAYSEFAGANFVNLPAESPVADPIDATPGDPSVMPNLSTGSAPEVDATLTIHNRRCPLEYGGTDFYGACHGNPVPRMPFGLAGPATREAKTGANGNVTLANLPPGAYEVWGGPPGDFVRNAMFCAPASAPGTPFPFTQTGNIEIAFDLAAADDVICDWYSVPEYRGTGPTPTPAAIGLAAGDETLTAYGALCPEGYRGSDYVAVCSTATVGAQVLLQDADTGAQLSVGGGFTTANEDGFATFDLGSLAPGAVILRAFPDDGDIPVGGFTVPLIACRDDAGNAVPARQSYDTRAVGLVAEIEIGESDYVRCDVYFLPLTPA